MGAPEHVLELERRIEVAHEQLEKLPMGGIKVRTIVAIWNSPAHTPSSGKLFNLTRLRAMSKVNRIIVHDAAIVSHTDTGLQSSCNSFARACDEFGLKINLGKTVVLSQGTASPPTIMVLLLGWSINSHTLEQQSPTTTHWMPR